jgi:hypothetical protein
MPDPAAFVGTIGIVPSSIPTANIAVTKRFTFIFTFLIIVILHVIVVCAFTFGDRCMIDVDVG